MRGDWSMYGSIGQDEKSHYKNVNFKKEGDILTIFYGKAIPAGGAGSILVIARINNTVHTTIARLHEVEVSFPYIESLGPIESVETSILSQDLMYWSGETIRLHENKRKSEYFAFTQEKSNYYWDFDRKFFTIDSKLNDLSSGLGYELDIRKQNKMSISGSFSKNMLIAHQYEFFLFIIFCLSVLYIYIVIERKNIAVIEKGLKFKIQIFFEWILSIIVFIVPIAGMLKIVNKDVGLVTSAIFSMCLLMAIRSGERKGYNSIGRLILFILLSSFFYFISMILLII